MLGFLDLVKYSRGLDPVTSSELLSRTGDFHPAGLFSESIFGPIGSMERRKTYSYINLNCYVIHPTALQLVLQLDRKIEKFLSTESSFALDSGGRLVESENGVTGINEFKKLFPKIKFRGETTTRERFIIILRRAFEDGTLFINKLPVIPPDFRPAFKDERGDLVTDKLNEYYLTVIRRSLQMKSAGSGPLYDLLNYGMQIAITEHDNFVRTKISKKSGLIRGNLLSKRVDFSGRAVITPGPDLKVNEVGVPMKIAVSIFEPFLIHVLLHTNYIKRDELESEIRAFTGLDLSVDSIRRVIRSIKSGDKIPDRLYQIFSEATELAMKDRVVICKRDPDLHALSIRGFYPKLVHGDTIQICTLQTGGFNADFDGDAMAIYHPLTDEAQQEIKQKMMRAAGGSSSSKLTFGLAKEMWAGLYVMTKPTKSRSPYISVSKEDLDSSTDPYIPVRFNGINTTMGRAIFNNCLPKDYPFIDEQVTKKVVERIIANIIDKYGDDIAREVASRLEKTAFKFATILAPTIAIDDLQIPKEIYKLKEKLVKATPEEAADILAKMREIMIDYLKGTGFYDLVESGSTKGWDQPMQILVAKGIIADATGKILPVIKGSFSDGLTTSEFFNASPGARKGIIDRVLNTADTGYMSRQLVYILSPVELHPTLKDCKTDRTLDLKLEKDMISRFTGRYIIKGSGVQKFNSSTSKPGDIINLRTPIYCRSKKICHTCYGDLLYKHKTPYVGVLAAQTIGEVGTQLIMRTFHTGGAVKLSIRDILSDIVENDQIVTLETARKYLKQVENTLICNEKCKVTIDPDEYEIGDNLEINEDNIWMRGCIARIEFADSVFNVILDYAVELNIPNENNVSKELIELVYEPNEVILVVPLEAQQMKENVLYVKRLLGGREVYSSIEHLYKKLYKVYAPISDMDSVHLEVLLSQCLRDKTNVSIPARLGKTWDPTILNIKKAIFSSGFVQGLAFENINEAIKTGLISPDVEDSSVIEKVLTGTLVVEEEE